MDTQLVVIGGGPGGYAAAFLAADLGMKTVIVEQDPRLGGTCLLRGCIPSKALLHVARVISESREMHEWGVSFGEPKVDIQALRARKEKVIATLSGGLKQLAKKRNVQVINAKAVFESSAILRLEGGDPATYSDGKLNFEHCILASGSVPAMPGPWKLPSGRVMTSTGALELADIPESLLVIGGGYIGLEMGSVYSQLGTQVSVVELFPHLLPQGVDRDLVKPLADRMGKVCKNIYLETKVAGLKDVDRGVEVTFEKSGQQFTETYSRVLVAVGRRPNSQGMGLENTQVAIDAKGFVQTDERQRTADPRILAIGDVCGEPMLAHKASHQGKVAVEALHGEPAAFEPLAIPAVVFTDPEIAWAGLTEEQAKLEGVPVEVARYPWAASGKAQAIGRTEGLTKILFDPATDRVLGVGITGPNAGDLISEGVLAIEMGATARDLGESIHPHPTLSETVAFSAEAYLGTATEIYKPRRAAKAAT
jgi:dihydrolipoamide dehydrogenase